MQDSVLLKALKSTPTPWWEQFFPSSLKSFGRRVAPRRLPRDYSLSRPRASGLESWVDPKCAANNSAETKPAVPQAPRAGPGLDPAGQGQRGAGPRAGRGLDWEGRALGGAWAGRSEVARGTWPAGGTRARSGLDCARCCRSALEGLPCRATAERTMCSSHLVFVLFVPLAHRDKLTSSNKRRNAPHQRFQAFFP